MSYEDAVQSMRERSVEPAPFEDLARRRAEAPTVRTSRVAVAATVAAGLGFLALFVRPWFTVADNLGGMSGYQTRAVLHRGLAGLDGLTAIRILALNYAALLPAVLVLLAVRWCRMPKLGAQLLCRSAWWSSLVVGLLVALNYGDQADKCIGAWIATACCLALAVSGDRGLNIHEPDHPFAPVRFRGHLLLALVMAAADALTLAFSGLMQLRFGMGGWTLTGTMGYAGPTVIAAMVMIVAVWGVYRLRTWALFLNLVANIAIAYLALEGTLNLSPSVSVTLAATAAIQCFIPVPILAAALGDRKSGEPFMPRVRRVLMRLAVVSLAAGSVAAVFMPGGDGWVDGPGRAFIRGAEMEFRSARRMTVRERLGATEDDLRARSFDGRWARNAQFDGADLRGASFNGAQLQRSSFVNANLEGASFRGAELDSNAAFVGAVLTNVDFTAARVMPDITGWDASTVPESITCPDGRSADGRFGCMGRDGKVHGVVLNARIVETEDEKSCPVGRILQTGQNSWTGFLTLLGNSYAWLDDGTLTNGGQTIDVDGTRWTLVSQACGRVVLDVGPLPRDTLVPGKDGPTDFSSQNLALVDFRGEVLRGASFERSELEAVRFDGADLRDANFRRALLDEVGFAFKGADLRGADFTGAHVSPLVWLGVEPSRLAGALCPDGAEASPELGCERVAALPSFDIPNVLEWDNSDSVFGCLPDPGPGSRDISGSTVLYVADGRLHAFDRTFVPTVGGRFVTADMTLIPAQNGSWMVQADACGGEPLRVHTYEYED